jgi:catechol 2,3-dioxygenase-like lactoylglutathione lyase family enzyme
VRTTLFSRIMGGVLSTRGVTIMIDHAAVNVSDLDAAKGFYSKALAPLGISTVMEVEGFAGYGSDKGFHFGVFRRDPVGGAHVAFACEDRAKVDDFYEAAVAAGGIDNGRPGIRAHYHENYYGAFVHDPDGNNIEGVCQKPQ